MCLTCRRACACGLGESAMGTVEDLLDDGWRYHDRESERLAAELEAVTAVPPERLAAFVHLAVHTIGEHLGDWPRAYALGRQILHGHEPDGATAPAWERLYVAATLSADGIGAATAELSALTVADDPLASLLAMRQHLVAALVSAGRITEAGQIYRPALDIADRAAPAPALDRTMAIVGNNLAWALHDLPARSPDEDGAMRIAADASLTAWRRCGSWINEELALYLGARVALARGDAASALDHAGAGRRVRPAPAQVLDPLMAELPGGQRIGQRGEVVLGIGARTRDAADIDHQIDLPASQQFDKLGNAARRMPDRVDLRPLRPSHASAARTASRSAGTPSASNHGWRAAQCRLRHDGCGSGKIAGRWSRKPLTRSVIAPGPSAPARAWPPTSRVSRRSGICASSLSRHSGAHSGRGGASPPLRARPG